MIAPNITINVGPREGRQQRLVIASDEEGKELARDSFNTNSAMSRTRFLKSLATSVNLTSNQLDYLHGQIIQKADEIDEAAYSEARQRGESDSDDKSQAEILVELAHSAEAELWHTDDQTGFATCPVENHRDNLPVRSRAFRLWLQQKFYEVTGRPASSQAMKDAIDAIDAEAIFKAQTHTAHVRLAEHDGSIYIDLANEIRQVVRIDKCGWTIIDDPPVRFWRPKGMLPLPTPMPGGDINQLRRFINVADDYWPLVLAWLVAALLPNGPYPLLCLFGEQGSAKSTTANLLRRLVDPNKAPIRAEPKDARDMMIAAKNSRILSFDNLSYLQPWFSDALCRLSTGGGFSTRMLYTDDEETIFDAQRPVIINGIEDVAARSDLIDRTLLIRLQAIPENLRKTEQELLRVFANEAPFIFGALLTAVAAGLKNVSSVKLDCKPRMADFAMWAVATETELGFEPGKFIEAYQRNQADANDVALESSPVATLLLDCLESKGQWEGTAGNLKTMLELPLDFRAPKGWPASARGMAGCLRRIAPNLRHEGWEVSQERDTTRKRNRIWRITRKPEGASTQTVRDPSDRADDADATRTVGNDGEASKSLDRTIADGLDDPSRTKSTDGSTPYSKWLGDF